MPPRRRPTIGADPLDAVMPRSAEAQPDESPSRSTRLVTVGISFEQALLERARNAVYWTPGLTLAELVSIEWDQGSEYFPPTSFQISNVHAGTGATNVTPSELAVLFNFRFSPASSVEGLQSRVRALLDRHGLQYRLGWTLSGLPFLTPRGALVKAVSDAVTAVIGVTPELSTSGVSNTRVRPRKNERLVSRRTDRDPLSPLPALVTRAGS